MKIPIHTYNNPTLVEIFALAVVFYLFKAWNMMMFKEICKLIEPQLFFFFSLLVFVWINQDFFNTIKKSNYHDNSSKISLTTGFAMLLAVKKTSQAGTETLSKVPCRGMAYKLSYYDSKKYKLACSQCEDVDHIDRSIEESKLGVGCGYFMAFLFVSLKKNVSA